jgi:hypothetical protein
LPPSFAQIAFRGGTEAQKAQQQNAGTTKAPLQRGKLIITYFAVFVKRFASPKADFRAFRGF